jgi:DNA-binding MarR family transcriptional regulator
MTNSEFLQMERDDPALWKMHAEAVNHLMEDLGAHVDLTGLELVRLIRILGHQFDRAASVSADDAGVTGPRWRLLLRLMAEEMHAPGEGMSPGYLSRCQSVSKNTISTLLRGLEDDGLVERALDTADRRSFRIQLTPAGRDLVRKSTPARLARLNELIAELTSEERSHLITLLTRLNRSLARHAPSND